MRPNVQPAAIASARRNTCLFIELDVRKDGMNAPSFAEHAAEIKTKPKGSIKKLDKSVVKLEKLKNNIVTTKEKINEFTVNEQNDTAEDYASSKIQNDINYLSRKGIEKGNDIGKKSLQETKQNFIKGKQKIETLKSRIKSKRINSAALPDAPISIKRTGQNHFLSIVAKFFKVFSKSY